MTPVGGSGGAAYTVTVSGITGSGTLGLNLVDDGSIRDADGNPLVQTNASAAFQAQATFAAGTSPFSVAVGDVNGDGQPDLLVVANYDSGNVSVLLGNGNGTFQAQATFAAGTGSFVRGGGGRERRRPARPGRRQLRQQQRERAAGERQRHVPGPGHVRRGQSIRLPWRWGT